MIDSSIWRNVNTLEATYNNGEEGEKEERENEFDRVQRRKEGILGSGGEDSSDHRRSFV